MRKWVLFLSILECVFLSYESTAETTIVYEGNGCGDNCAWSIDSDGKLTVFTPYSDFEGYIDDSMMFCDNKGCRTKHEWGEYASFITSVEIMDGITDIGEYAFFNLENITSVEIGNTIESIGQSSFSGINNLTNLTIGDSVESIEYDAFSGGNLTSLTLPESLTDISPFAFYGMKIGELVIPDGLELNLVQFLNGENLEAYSTSDLIDTLDSGDEELFKSIVSDFENTGGWHFNIGKISCQDGSDDCKENLYWPEELKLYLDPLEITQEPKESTKRFQEQADGSIVIYDADNHIIGFKNKRIYTIDEANLVAKPTGNTVRIKYR